MCIQATPLWSPIITASATLIGTLGAVWLTLFLTNRREAKRLEHERQMKIREERLRAYATLARLTKSVEATEPYQSKDVAEAHSEIEMLTDNSKLKVAADRLLGDALRWRKKARDWYIEGAENPYSHPEVVHARETTDRARNEFIRLAKEELRSTGGP